LPSSAAAKAATDAHWNMFQCIASHSDLKSVIDKPYIFSVGQDDVVTYLAR